MANAAQARDPSERAFWTYPVPPGTAVPLPVRIAAITCIASLVAVEINGTIPGAVFCASVLALGFFNLRNMPRSLMEWVPLLLPLYATLAFVISDEPAITLRFGIIGAITALAPILLARTMTPAGFMRVLALALAATLPLHFVLGETGFPMHGLMGSKNYFATRMAVTVFAGGFLLFDTGSRGWIRLLGLPMIGLAWYGIVRASSAGAILATSPALAALLAVCLAARLHGRTKGIVMTTAGVLVAFAAVVALTFWSELSSLVLGAFQKDAGLTGRDILWNRAAIFIPGKPWFGTGYGAFWVQGHLEAEGLWRALGIGSRFGFHFHNLYLNTLVETGAIGLAITVFLITGVLVMVVVWAIEASTPASAAFLAFHLAFLTRTYVEVDFPIGFGLVTFLVFSTWSFGLAYLATRRRSARSAAVPVLRGRMVMN